MADFNYKEKLLEVFLHFKSDRQIDETISIVLEENNLLSSEEKLEAMINLLVESGDSALVPNEVEGAVGFSQNTNADIINRHFDGFLRIFPDICPTYLTQFCQTYEVFDFDTIVEDLGKTDYTKIEKDPIDIWEQLKQMLPDADPIYLRNQARVLVTRPEGELGEFIATAIESKDYPSMQDYLKNQELRADLDVYINKFSVTEYLNRVPNPIETFSNPDRKPVLAGDANEDDVQFALEFLYNQFAFLRKKEIQRIFTHFNRHLVKTSNKLKILPKAFRNAREKTQLTDCKNVELLKEISFLMHEKAIRQHLKQQNDKYRAALEEARLCGLLQKCACCFDDELIPEECFFCESNCTFCKECVKIGAENEIGKGQINFPCLACESHFNYTTLQMVLDKKIFQGVWHRKQIQEIKNANLDGLETCPHCDFCMIPNENDKIFKCGNIDCMKETCRLCQHPAHIPLRCDEIEYDEDVKRRTYIENKMTEALLRTCWKCSKQFYKESGCNKMTCFCGAKMCYVCGAAVTDYAHFNNNVCPLYTENLQQFHLNRVLQGAQTAKNELGIATNPTMLKFDPTRNIENQVV